MTNQTMKTVKFKINLAQAYLEMARAHHGAPVRAAEGADGEKVRMTDNTMIALVAHGYVFSFMALNAFISSHLWNVWRRRNSPLRTKYPDAKDFTHLLKVELRELKDCISELCLQLGLAPLHKANPKLWNELLQVLKTTRDFMTHPTPDPATVDKIVGDAIKKHSWECPTKITESVMRYFYTELSKPEPKWLRENQEFCICAVGALKVAPKG